MSTSSFSSKELQLISSQLDTKHSYQGCELCNHIIGFNNWSSEIRELRLYYTTEDTSADGKVSYSSGASAICRMVLRDGSHRDAVGSGESSGAETKMKSIEVAQQAAVKEAQQRCVEQFQAGHSHVSHPTLLTTSKQTETMASMSTPPCDLSDSTAPPSSSSMTTASLNTINTGISGQKRGLPQDQPFQKLHTPAPFTTPSLASNHANPHSHPQSSITITTNPDVVQSSASPTLEDIDSLMQQYDQVHKAEAIPASASSSSSVSHVGFGGTTGAVTTSAPTQIRSTHSKEPSSSTSSSYPPTHHHHAIATTSASLKGQKYPPKPNLQDPFGKQKK